jgi:hypothetical protein
MRYWFVNGFFSLSLEVKLNVWTSECPFTPIFELFCPTSAAFQEPDLRADLISAKKALHG